MKIGWGFLTWKKPHSVLGLKGYGDGLITSISNINFCAGGFELRILVIYYTLLALEDIAYTKNLTVQELLTEIERIVSSGTKVNINYYINEYVDEYHQDEIYEYFTEAETDSIEEALNELGEDEFNEEEIRLMRIKFLSEVGN